VARRHYRVLGHLRRQPLKFWAAGISAARLRVTRRCPVTNYTFPGFRPFLEAAACQIGRPEAEGPARRITTLSALANPCAQATVSERANAPAIMTKAAEFRDQLHAAYAAAELMIAQVNQALGLGCPPTKMDREVLSAWQTRSMRSKVQKT
jgi:hypothetical protein